MSSCRSLDIQCTYLLCLAGRVTKKFSWLPKFSVTTSTWSKKSRKRMKQLQNTGPLRLNSLSTLSKGFLKTYISLHPKYISELVNILQTFKQASVRYLRKVQRMIIVDIPNVSLAVCSDIESVHLVYKASVNSQDKHGEQLNFMYFASKNTRNDSKVCCPLIGQKNTKVFWHQSEAKMAWVAWWFCRTRHWAAKPQKRPRTSGFSTLTRPYYYFARSTEKPPC